MGRSGCDLAQRSVFDVVTKYNDGICRPSRRLWQLRGKTSVGFGPWRKNLFIAMSHLSADAADSFCLPRDQTLIMGSRIQV
jgi:hypothetical protein